MTDSTDFGADLCAVTRKSDENGVTVTISGVDFDAVKDRTEVEILAEEADGNRFQSVCASARQGLYIDTVKFIRRDDE